MDKLIFDAMYSIYSNPNNKNSYGKVDLFSFSKPKLARLLPTEAITHIESGKCPYGRFQTYGGSLGRYSAINPTSQFYQEARK